ncbi:hypothetical protein F5B22DRAFT_602742 [Xylaria bambusicola]|uniref:uncharacterized protein n=1 Tax=Xylaria bambusicola TaxID=326684 RepID=UPI0020082B23|nr:uncharacterized protein F5B22DRAFT_602742 [Xylaria bambusicola]KAI0517866.1 hypothetical protein F5B22DRAFT_602742 [Xylaria bambusicola]
MKYPLSRVRRTASSRDHENNHTDEDDDDDENIAGIGERPPSHIAPGAHCHHHFPIHKTSFLPGLLKINKNSEPQCLAYFMDWISQGIESGWIHKRELRFSKFEDLIIGACIFKHHKKRLCVHEIATSMRAANSECAGGRIGCHVCVGNWGKDYFRFDAREAPNQCECAWYY